MFFKRKDPFNILVTVSDNADKVDLFMLTDVLINFICRENVYKNDADNIEVKYKNITYYIGYTSSNKSVEFTIDTSDDEDGLWLEADVTFRQINKIKKRWRKNAAKNKAQYV